MASKTSHFVSLLLSMLLLLLFVSSQVGFTEARRYRPRRPRAPPPPCYYTPPSTSCRGSGS